MGLAESLQYHGIVSGLAQAWAGSWRGVAVGDPTRRGCCAGLDFVLAALAVSLIRNNVPGWCGHGPRVTRGLPDPDLLDAPVRPYRTRIGADPAAFARPRGRSRCCWRLCCRSASSLARAIVVITLWIRRRRHCPRRRAAESAALQAPGCRRGELRGGAHPAAALGVAAGEIDGGCRLTSRRAMRVRGWEHAEGPAQYDPEIVDAGAPGAARGVLATA